MDEVRAKLERATGCKIQYGGYPCNTCFHALDIEGLREDIHEYWLAVLAHRGDYPELPRRDDLVRELSEKLE
ncbi:hypothetical protein ACFLRF_04860 [Candidatus Altiarchaeota archaeon]